MDTEKKQERSFVNSELLLLNRKLLKISGVEKMFETSENKIQIQVMHNLLLICGKSLTVEKFNVETGEIEISGEVNDLKFFDKSNTKESFLKRIFK